MAHGAGMAVLGIPTEEIAIDMSRVVFNQLTLRGIYGREMYETWYQMSVMLQSGLDISPAITHRFDYREHEAAFAAARSGRLRQSDHGLEVLSVDHPIRCPSARPTDDMTPRPIRSPSSRTSWRPSASATCTARCGS